MQISYLEIYNDRGYDLLDENHQTKLLEDLPKVSLMENANGVIFLSLKIIGICYAWIINT